MKLRRATLVIFAGVTLSLGSGNCASTDEPVEVVLHFDGGLSPGSEQEVPAEYQTQERLPEILFLDRPTHFHIQLRNRTNIPLHLWRPYCPEADRALVFEFKDAGQTGTVGRARISMDYTGGMGIPKVVKIAPKDALIIDVDFCNYWDFPFQIPAGKHKDVFLRLIYDPEPTEFGKQGPLAKMKPIYDAVWTGRAESTWIKVRMINRANEDKPKSIAGRD